MGSAKIVTGIASIVAGIAHLEAFVEKNMGRGYSWAVLVREEDDSLVVHERHGHPCYGEMRPYAKGKSGYSDQHYASYGYPAHWEPELFPEDQRKVGKPVDLFWPFPVGTPLALGVPIYSHPKTDVFNSMMENVVYSPLVSPWRQCLANTKIIHNDKHVAGIVFTETDFDPTIAVNMFRKTANNLREASENIKYWLEHGASEVEAFILANIMSVIFKNISYNSGDYSPFGVTPDMSRILNGEANSLTDGGTFRKRYAYNRPMNDYLFKGENFAQLVGKELGKKGDYITFTEKEIPTILSVMRSLVKVKQSKVA